MSPVIQHMGISSHDGICSFHHICSPPISIQVDKADAWVQELITTSCRLVNEMLKSAKNISGGLEELKLVPINLSPTFQ